MSRICCMGFSLTEFFAQPLEKVYPGQVEECPHSTHLIVLVYHSVHVACRTLFCLVFSLLIKGFWRKKGASDRAWLSAIGHLLLGAIHSMSLAEEDSMAW